MSEDIRKEPLSASSTEPSGGPSDYPALDYGEEPPFPRTVTAAGVIWIVFGCLVLVFRAAGPVLGLFFDDAGKFQGLRDFMLPYGIHQLSFVALFGVVFLHVCIQSVRGTARDTLGYGIGSILFGLLYFGCAAIEASVGDARFSVAVTVLGGAMLLAAGVLALMGRSQYKQWQMAQKARLEQEARRRFRE